MNWQNYDRLVQHLETMPRKDFNYNYAYAEPDRSGCLACQCLSLQERDGYSEPADIQDFLGVTTEESRYLYGHHLPTIDPVLKRRRPGFDGIFSKLGNAARETGIREALRRLAVVAARYQRPAEEPEAVAVVPDDAAFLESVYALVRGPLVDARGE